MHRWTLSALILACVSLGQLHAADWPGFRGPNRDGSAGDTALPVSWTKDNILWKVKLPGPGSSSPITYGDRVFVTCYAGYGTTLTKGMGGKGGGFGKGGGKGGDKGGAGAGDQEKLTLHLLCLDRNSGKILWQKDIQPKLPEVSWGGFIREHGYASSTPATDGERVYVFFGKTGVLAFDMEGKQLWQTDVGSRTDKWGSASSPVLYEDLVIVNAAIESDSLVGLDKKAGKEVWRTKGMGTVWSSPILVETKDNKTELVVSMPGKVAGYDPHNGKELWHCKGIGTVGAGYTISTPVARDGVVYTMGGGGPTQPAALAVRTGGRGDVNDTHVLWRQGTGSGICSPIFSGGNLCWVSGDVMCLNPADGKTVYKERLYDGREYVSPVVAGDKILALTRGDGLYVLAGGAKFEELAHNLLEDDDSMFNASPAVSDGRIFLRSNANLYCVGQK